MTRASIILGASYDDPLSAPVDARACFAKRAMLKAALERLNGSEDISTLELLRWETALLHFSPVPDAEGRIYYPGGSYEQFATDFGLTASTMEYALERAQETRDPILRLHYLAFVVAQMPQTGKEWIDRQRTILALWREYVDGCCAAAGTAQDSHLGSFVDQALRGIEAIIARPGLLRSGEPQNWVNWLLQLAVEVRAFPGPSENREEFWRHRWVVPCLRVLAQLPPSAADAQMRGRALALLNDAAAYYATDPLADTFALYVAEVRYELRVHWADRDAHKDKIREQVEALLRRAKLHRDSGNGMSSQHFFRNALSLAQTHRQHFHDAEIDEMMREERAAIEHAIASGEFKRIAASIEIPSEQLARLKSSADETVAALVADVATPLPTRESLEMHMRAVADSARLHSLLPVTIVGQGKVVGESEDAAKNLELQIERYAILQASIAGQAVSTTIVAAATQLGLSAEHLLAPLAPLRLDTDAEGLIRRGCERLIAQDFVSACHVLVPRVEEVLRRQLRARGLHATEFKANVGDGTSRTDDEPLGSMLSRSFPNGTTVRDYLGDDFARHIEWTMLSQTGLNLRNSFAHGFARLADCTPANAGIVLAILYRFAVIAGS